MSEDRSARAFVRFMAPELAVLALAIVAVVLKVLD